MAGRCRFADYADLKPALLEELRRLRVRYAEADLAEAIAVVASNLRLVAAASPKPAARSPKASAIAVDARPIGRFEAAALLSTIAGRVGHAVGPRRLA